MTFAAYIPVSHHPRTDAGFLTAYELFQQGYDTDEIARMRWQSEAQVLRELTIERCKARGLPNPYEAAQ